jgi:hypothetical protein
MIEIEQEGDGQAGRFVIYEADEFAGELVFNWSGESKFTIEHTSVEAPFKGKGFGKQLVMEAIAFARKNELKIVPVCSFAQRLFNEDQSLQTVRD